MGNYGQPKMYWASILPNVIKTATKVTEIVARKTTVFRAKSCIFINSILVKRRLTLVHFQIQPCATSGAKH